MTEAIEMGFKSLHSRTDAMSEGLSGLDKSQNKTNKGFNDIMDLVRDMRAKVQDLIRMQDSISNQFKTVDQIMMGNTASDYEVKEYVAPKTRSPPKKLSLSEDEEDYKPAPRAPIKFDELSDEEPAAPVSATTVEIEVEAPAEEPAAEEPAAEEAAAEEAVAEEAAAEEEAAEEPAGEADAVADEEADLAAAEEAARKAEEEEQLRREEEELAALEAEEAELLRLEEEEALRKEEEELRRLEEEEEEARRIAEEELRKLEEEEEARKKAEEEELKKKEEEEKKKGKFPPPKKTPGKLNKFQVGGKNKVVFK